MSLDISNVDSKTQSHNTQPIASFSRAQLDEKVFLLTPTGADNFAHIEVKVPQNTLQRFYCPFTRLKTNAVFIEVAESLDAES